MDENIRSFPEECGECQHFSACNGGEENLICSCDLLKVDVDLLGSWLKGYKCPLDDLKK